MRKRVTTSITLSPKQLAFLCAVPAHGKRTIKLQKDLVLANGLHRKGLVLLSWELVSFDASRPHLRVTSHYVILTDFGRSAVQQAKASGRCS